MFNTTVFAVKPNGSAWGWGRNDVGQLGNNASGESRSSPVAVVGNHSFVEMAGGFIHSSARKADGSVWCWGNNTFGQLGTGSTVSYSSPVMVVGNHSFVKLSSGDGYFCLALKANGSAWSWGSNTAGQLGDGSRTDRNSPVAVIGNHSFIKVGASGSSSYGLKADGSVWTWGFNSVGQLGNNTTTSYSSPIAVVGNHSFVDVRVGSLLMMGLKADGSVWTWGSNPNGELGDNSTTNRSSPVPVVGNHSFVKIGPGYENCAALKADGSCWVWGRNAYGYCGTNLDGNSYSSPVAVVGNHSFIRMNLGNGSMIALKANGQAWGWGRNQNTEIGDNTGDMRSSPVPVVGSHVFSFLTEGFIVIEDIVLFQGLVWDGWTWGEQNPTGYTPLPWSDWKVKESASDARDTGDWGVLRLLTGEEFVSTVKDLGDFGGAERLLKITTDDYASGSGSGTIEWRGHVDTLFNQDDDEVSGPAWEAYPSIGANKNWRYVQIKVST